METLWLALEKASKAFLSSLTLCTKTTDYGKILGFLTFDH